MGDAANDPKHPITTLFVKMLASPPMDAEDLEHEVNWQTIKEQRALGAAITRVIGQAVLHQLAAQDSSGPHASSVQAKAPEADLPYRLAEALTMAQAVCAQVVEIGKHLPNTLYDVLPAAKAALAARR